MSRVTVPIGPQHPLLKEPIALRLDVVGERVVAAEIEIGYVHRGLERLLQGRTFQQGVAVVERICGICSHAHTTAYCQAVEALIDVDLPPRAAAIRTLLCELERLHSHLLWLGVLSEAIGFTTVFMYAWRDREQVLDAMELISGGRIAHGANVVGGVREDVSPAQAREVLTMLRQLEMQLGLYQELVERDRSFHRRTRGIAVLSAAQVQAYGVVGPMARASGATLDIRRSAPYAAYGWLEVPAAVTSEGDVWARAWTRVQELQHSIDLCRTLLSALPAGPLARRVAERVQAGEAVSRVEAPRGELFYYVRSEGERTAARVKARTPTLPALLAMAELLPGLQTGDIAAVVAGCDLCMACADR